MAENDQQIATSFLEAWSPEFAKSVEMFTGQTISIRPGGDAKPEQLAGGKDSILWQTQAIECGLTGSVWIGTPASTRLAVTESLAEDTETRDSLYRELLRQSLEGATHVLSPGQGQRLVCKSPLQDGSPPPDLSDVKVAWVNMPKHEPAPILVGFQSDFVALMLAVENGASDEPAPPSSPAAAQGAPSSTEPAAAEAPASGDEPHAGSMRRIDRLADLELPIAVVLGRARVRIQDVLKLTAGSLVELDRRSGDSVEIVVHNAVVARGEVVSVGGNYAVKIREVMSRNDREALQTSASRSPRGMV